MSTSALNKARFSQNNDEFYTRLEDIEEELQHYQNNFAGKVVYCNCDDYKHSNFVKYFRANFQVLGLKKLVSTNYIDQQYDLFTATPRRPYLFEYDGNTTRTAPLQGDGDFRSGECIELLKQSDVVVTNPPFSLLKEYIPHLFKFEKQFLILGTLNAVKYSAVFPLLKAGKFWLGRKTLNGDTLFDFPKDYVIKDRASKVVNGKTKLRVGGVGWFTNLGQYYDRPEIILTKYYTPEEHPQYDNYNAINVDKLTDIPQDYPGLIGVPISIYEKYNTNQFEIVDYLGTPLLHGKSIYGRIITRNKKLNHVH